MGGPEVCSTAGSCLINELCVVLIQMLVFTLVGPCGVVDDIPFDVLLGMDFLRCTPFLISFQQNCLVNPHDRFSKPIPFY